MTDEQPWLVVVHNDDVHTFADVAYVMREVYGLPPGRGWALAAEVHERGETDLTWCAGREQAEELAGRIQLFGLRATVRGGHGA